MRQLKVLPFPLLVMLLFGPLLFQGGQVGIEHELPERIEQGSSREVTVRVRKGERSGFAKLEMRVPDGLRMEAVEKSGSSFTFEDGTGKFLWMAMPEGAEFYIKYRLIADSSATGDRKISGELRYIEENDRKTTVMEEKTIRVVEELEEADPKEEEKKAEKAPRVTREIEKLGEKRFMVRLNVEKKDLSAFGKITEEIPKGFKALSDEEEGSSFTFHEGSAKFVWMSLPEFPSFWVQYRLVATTAKPGEYDIEGVFSFMEDGESAERQIPSTHFQILGGEQATNKNEGSDEEKKDEGDGKKKGEPVVEEEDEGKEEDEKVTDVPDPQEGIDFKVQICAGHDPVEEDHFEKVYDFEEDFDIEQHQGWIKYTTGKFDLYENARDQRVHYRDNFELPGPFVTAYNEGQRISVQEALMIAEQEWIP